MNDKNGEERVAKSGWKTQLTLLPDRDELD
jgi:hypothetical protein